jgi:hypothetical protein
MPLNIFDGSSWNPLKKIQIHDGTSWNDSKAAYVWSGSEWKNLLGLVPVNTVLPTLSLQGSSFLYAAEQTVLTTNGTWENSPTTFEYQWQKAPYPTSNWSNILDKTSSSLALIEDEWDSQQTLKYVGYAVRCKVSATNADGKNSGDIYTLSSPVIAPANLGDITVNVVSNGVVEFTWQKVRGANDYYIQYQGPEVAFTEVTSMVNNTDSAKGVYSTSGTTCKFTIDTGSASGTLGILINPMNTSNVSGMSLSGYGKNASVTDLKPNKPSVAAGMLSYSYGGKMVWSATNITVTSWTVYNDGSIYATSASSSPSNNFLDIARPGASPDTFGSFVVLIIGTSPRFSETAWLSSPALTITYPPAPNDWYCTESYNGGGIGNCGYTKPGYDNSGSGSGFSRQCTFGTTYPACQSTAPAPTNTWKCTTSSPGAGVGNCSYTDPGFDNSGSGSGYSRQCTLGTSYPACQSTDPAPANPYVWYCTTSSPGAGVGNCSYTTPGFDNSASGSGYSRQCINNNTGTYPACQSTDPAPVFAPPGFFAPPVFGGKGLPPDFGFAPPFFPPFFPPGFFAPPVFKSKCLSPDALVLTTSGFVKAKDIATQDELISISGLNIDLNSVYANKTSQALPEIIEFLNVKVISVTEKTGKLVGFNEIGKNYSITQPIFIKTENGIEYRNAGDINIGDVIISIGLDGVVSDIVVESIETDNFESIVYDIRTSPQPWFIVNSTIAIA